jgi:hypothetical protein
MRRYRFFALVWLTLVPLLATGSPAAAEEPAGDAAALRRAVLEGFEPGQTSRLLDLTQEVHRRYVAIELAEAGLSAEAYPALHAAVAKAATQPAAFCRAFYDYKTRGVVPFHEVELDAREGAPADDDQEFEAVALLSLPEELGVRTSTLTLGFYDDDGEHLPCDDCAPVAVLQDYGRQPELELELQPRLAATRKATALGTFLYVVPDGANEALCAGVHRMSFKPNPPVQTVINLAPADRNNDHSIRICLNRYPNQYKDCDEYHPENTINDIVFDVRGYVRYKKPVQLAGGKPVGVQGDVWILRRDGGGACPALVGRTPFGLSVSNDRLRVSWDIPRERFGDGSRCIHQQDRITYHLQLGLRVEGETEPVWAYVTNRAGASRTNYRDTIPEDMYFLWGCLKEGTTVTLANGTTRRIEQLAVHDLVRTHLGRTLEVVETTSGTETEPLVCIRAGAGQPQLCLTGGHPVMTPRGPVLARELTAGSQVLTAAGPVPLTRVDRVRHSGKVHNVRLGIPRDQQRRLDPNETTLFAHGIAVGDLRMQTELGRIDRARHGTVIERLPPHWLRDYWSWCRRTGTCGQAAGDHAPAAR